MVFQLLLRIAMFRADPETINLSNGDAIAVLLRRSTKAKNVRIHIMQHHKCVELVIPKRTSLSQAQNFLFSKENWIRETLAKTNNINLVKLLDQEFVNVMGKQMQIIHYPNSGTSYIDGDKIIIRGLKEFLPKKVQRLLANLLLSIINELVDNMCSKLKIKFNKINIKDTKTRWGSCSASGNLAFCWRLVFAPLEVVEYVVAHEVSHLVEMNHSSNFWRIVSSLVPLYKKHKTWLSYNGVNLSVDINNLIR